MAVTVIVRAKLKADPATIRKLHDQVTGATREMAKAAGDISHRTFLDPADSKQFLGIDVWTSPDAFQKFSSDPQIQQFFGQMFDGMPEVTVWTESGWNSW